MDDMVIPGDSTVYSIPFVYCPPRVKPMHGEDVRLISGYDVNAGGMTAVFDELEVDGELMSVCTDGECLYYSDFGLERNWLVRMSLSDSDCVDILPAPPGEHPSCNLSDTHCVSNGQLFMVGNGDCKLFRMRLLPGVSDHLELSSCRFRHPVDGLAWEPVANLPLEVIAIDVVARADDKFQFVCLGCDDGSERYSIHFVDYDGTEKIVPCKDARMCRFVPSRDELVCVATNLMSSTVSWSIILVDVWCGSVLSTLDHTSPYGCDPFLGCHCYLTITENDRVVVAQQHIRDRECFFEVAVWQVGTRS
ncbi:hypothetical protein FOZ63_028201 [Perkinsus olseni]|uniref:Uncharacterized protein n=1 Tax=Perkinsus olseni TaxID=32597 RepID=A0A7J6RL49_PEROL|nr:hypothetical protein FOZ63_028201 [Perkinsus olseni]KAF4731681.1 hypothetical protein FOZ62_028598 [Perkinsus olseni]